MTEEPTDRKTSRRQQERERPDTVGDHLVDPERINLIAHIPPDLQIPYVVLRVKSEMYGGHAVIERFLDEWIHTTPSVAPRGTRPRSEQLVDIAKQHVPSEPAPTLDHGPAPRRRRGMFRRREPEGGGQS